MMLFSILKNMNEHENMNIRLQRLAPLHPSAHCVKTQTLFFSHRLNI